MNKTTSHRLREIVSLFLKLGNLRHSAAHIAMMEEDGAETPMDEPAAFFRPGGRYQPHSYPNSTEMTMHCAISRTGGAWGCSRRASVSSSLLCSSPAVCHLYAEYGKLPQVGRLLYGIKFTVLIIILSAVIAGEQTLRTCSWRTRRVCRPGSCWGE